MKISILSNTDFNIENMRPIGTLREHFELIEDHYEADVVYVHLDYLNCNKDYQIISQTKEFQDNIDRCVMYAMHDTPSFAYQDKKSKKFLAQPIYSLEKNREYNIISVPLQMRHFEWHLTRDKDFINRCRDQKKEYDFCFIGQTPYADRSWLKPENINLGSYLFKETTPIWGVSSLNDRLTILKEFCLEVSKCKFAFAPRGVGSSSFRLYQSLMVGTIPIISGMTDFPFSEDLEWEQFSVIDNEKRKHLEVYQLNYIKMRERAIEVWDDYFDMPKTDKYIFNRYLEKK